MVTDQVIIVEGRQDKLKLQPILDEYIEIICTNGTFSRNSIEQMLEPFECCEFYAFFDEDEMGKKHRKLFNSVYPESNHLYTRSVYGGVEQTPRKHLARVLQDAGFAVKRGFLLSKG